MKIDNAIDKLNAAYRRLEEPQGRIARRNARKAFLYALQCLRKGLDDEYPLERKSVRVRRKPRKGLNRVSGMTVVSEQEHHDLLRNGVSPSYFTTIRVPPNAREETYMPLWMRHARNAGFDWRTIARAVKSRKTRRRIAATVRLGGRVTSKRKKKP